MPTYKLGPASVRGVPPKLTVRRPVICEQCAEALGNVDAPAALNGMSAVLVAAMWPEMKLRVEEHEEVCPHQK
jgi:hypothetical protein